MALSEPKQLYTQILFIPERKGEPDITLASIEKLSQNIGWSPNINLNTGIGLFEKIA